MQLSPLRYAGGKSKACKTLEKYLPNDFQTVVSPFFGGGSFENYLSLRGKEVVGYDLCDPLVDFWQAFISNREELFNFSEALSNIINGSEDKAEQRGMFSEWKRLAVEDSDPFNRGLYFFAANRCCFSGATLASGLSFYNIGKRFGLSTLRNLSKIDFKVKSVTKASCFDVIPNVDCDLMYLDPPYILESESKEVLYGKGGELHDKFDHVLLRDQLRETKTQWILSYMNLPRVHELYEGFNTYEEQWTYSMKSSKGAGSNPIGKELVITNF